MVSDEKTSVGAPAEILSRDFVLLFIASCFFIGSLYLLLPILPLYMKETAGASTVQVGLLVGALTFSSFVLRPVVGYSGDKVGMKPLMLLGAVDFIIASLLYMVTRSIWSLAILLVFHGAGVACYHTTSLAFVGVISPKSRRGQSMAWFQSSFNLGIMVAPIMGEFLMDRFGFTEVFIAAAAVAAASLVALMPVREHKVSSLVEEVPGPPVRVREKRGAILLVSIAVFAGGSTLGMLEAFLALFAEAQKISRFALFFTIGTGIVILLRIVAGSLPDRLGRKPTVLAALVLLASSMFVLSFTGGFGQLCLAAALWGFGFAFLNPTLSALLVDRTPEGELGGAFGLFTAAFEGGITFGAMAMGPVVSGFGFGYAFFAVGLLCLLGAIFYGALFKRFADEQPPGEPASGPRSGERQGGRGSG
jgi:MFS family permease